MNAPKKTLPKLGAIFTKHFNAGCIMKDIIDIDYEYSLLYERINISEDSLGVKEVRKRGIMVNKRILSYWYSHLLAGLPIGNISLVLDIMRNNPYNPIQL